MKIRAEHLDDMDAVHQVNVRAFGRDSEAKLVARLRGSIATLSLSPLSWIELLGISFLAQ